MLSNCPVHWVSKLQSQIALSTVESEYLALSQAMRDLLPMIEYLEDLQEHIDIGYDKNVKLKSTVFEDNNGCITTATSPKMSPRTKHIGVKYHFFKSKIIRGGDEKEGEDGPVEIEKINTEVQIADIFTKGLSQDKFQALRKLLCGW